MRIFIAAVTALLLLGSATLFAQPEEPGEPLLGYEFEAEIPAAQSKALMKALSSKPAWQAHVDATFLRVAAAHADEVLGEHRPDELGSARLIPAELARKLVASARGQGAVRPEPLPPLVLYDGLTGRLSATGRHTYLQDYDVEIGMGGGRLGDAIVGQIADGARLDVMPRRQGGRLLVDVRTTWAELIRPVPIHEATLSRFEGAQITIELPELRLFHVKERVELPLEGGYVLAGGGKAWDGETLRLVVLEIRVPKS